MATEPAAAGPGQPTLPARVILLAGPSGSGKSTLVRAVGVPIVSLDDFYRSGTDPGLPVHPELGIVDWDHPDSWDRTAAVAALQQLCRDSHAELPVYDFAANAAVGSRTVEVGSGAFVAEGLFAPELVGELHARGMLLDAIVVRRRRWKNLLRRAARDLREHRKPPVTIARRGMNLYRVESRVVGHAMGAGCRPLDAPGVRAAVAGHRAP